MILDIVICTYNRPDKVCALVEQIITCDPDFHHLIVVDSSEIDNESLKKNHRVTYKKSTRKSQPYQRFIGAESSNADIICFLDDDVKILEKDLFKDIITAFEDPLIVGVSLGIIYENGIQINQQKVKKVALETGKISWLGKTTGLPNSIALVEYFPGPIMSYRKTIIVNLFDEYLFSIFEKRIAIPEDKYISMKALKYGGLLFLGNKKYLHHPPIASTYFKNEVDFIAKTTFSRLWISKQYAETFKKPMWKAYFIFLLYLVKQLIFAIGNKTKFKGNVLAIKWLLKN